MITIRLAGSLCTELRLPLIKRALRETPSLKLIDPGPDNFAALVVARDTENILRDGSLFNRWAGINRPDAKYNNNNNVTKNTFEAAASFDDPSINISRSSDEEGIAIGREKLLGEGDLRAHLQNLWHLRKVN